MSIQRYDVDYIDDIVKVSYGDYVKVRDMVSRLHDVILLPLDKRTAEIIKITEELGYLYE